MGCDISVLSEIKADNRWQLLRDWTSGPPYVERNYELFSVLADVRNIHSIMLICSSGSSASSSVNTTRVRYIMDAVVRPVQIDLLGLTTRELSYIVDALQLSEDSSASEKYCTTEQSQLLDHLKMVYLGIS